MSDLIKRAVTGDDDPRDVLLHAGVEGLKSHAGYTPQVTENPIAPHDHVDENTFFNLLMYATNRETIPDSWRGVSGEARKERVNILLENLRGRLKSRRLDAIDSYAEAEALGAYVGGAVQMPLMPILQMSLPIHVARQWCNGRGWIAGSAALWCVSERSWRYGDIDIWATSKECYLEMYRQLQKVSDEYETHDDHVVAWGWTLDKALQKHPSDDKINLICPRDNENWSSPTQLLKSFDLTVAAVCLTDEQGYVYDAVNPASDYAFALEPAAVRADKLFLLEGIKPTVRTLTRIIKYMHRGFSLTSDLRRQLFGTEELEAVFRLLGEVWDVDHTRELADGFNRYADSYSSSGNRE